MVAGREWKERGHGKLWLGSKLNKFNLKEEKLRVDMILFHYIHVLNSHKEKNYVSTDKGTRNYGL